MVKAACVVAVVLAVGYAFFALCGPEGVSALGARRQEIMDLERSNTVLARDIEERRERINRLRESPSQQELEIRQRLKLVDPDDKVYVLPDPKK